MSQAVRQKEPFLFLAGSWFAAVFSIPVALFWYESDKSAIMFLFFVAPPMLVSFLCGEAFGSDILDSGDVQTSRQALIKGFETSLLTYLFFVPVFTIIFAVYLCIFQHDPHEWLTIQFLKNIFVGLFYVGVVGTLVVGWLLAILGALAGWTLFKFRLINERP